VKLGYIQPQPEEMWLQLHHCFGRTTVLVARRAGRVVATASVFHDGAMGLPVERSYPKASRRHRRDGSVLEIGSLAVAPEERGTGLAVLVQTAALYCGGRVLGASHCLITVPYYETLFGFSQLRQDQPYHGFQRPAVLMHLALERFDTWSRVYSDPPAGWHTVRSFRVPTSARDEVPASTQLQGLEETQEGRLVTCLQLVERIPGCGALAAMPTNSLRQRARPAVVQVALLWSADLILIRPLCSPGHARPETDAPQRCRPPLRAGGISFSEVVCHPWTQIVKQQVRVGSDVLVAELCERMKRARGHLRSMARPTAHVIEHLFPA
jgi:GNAT superfamily N-acetyltransferase